MRFRDALTAAGKILNEKTTTETRRVTGVVERIGHLLLSEHRPTYFVVLDGKSEIFSIESGSGTIDRLTLAMTKAGDEVVLEVPVDHADLSRVPVVNFRNLDWNHTTVS